MVRFIVLLLAAVNLVAATHLRYWVEPCTRPDTGCKAGDTQLAVWALEAWQAAAGGSLTFEKSADAENTDLRVHWAGAREGMYGEARGGDIYVRPSIVPAGEADDLLRDVVVFLSCVHESGHALGLPHTSDFADIMYSFQYGGDIREYFGRYRRLLRTRNDIRKHDGMSEQDRTRLRTLYR